MEEYWGSFWDHVDDLRFTFLRSFVAIGAVFLLVLMFYQPILQFLTAHSEEHTKEGLIKQRVQRIQIVNQTLQNQNFELPHSAHIISNSIHPATRPNSFYLEPGEALLYEEAIPTSFLVMGPLDGLILVFKVCFWISLVLTAPIWCWIWLQFILPGLKKQERSFLFPFLLLSVICISSGIGFAYYVTLPIANQYLMLFNNSIGQNAWTLTHYVNYVLFLCLGHAIAAELVLFLFMLVHFGFLSASWLIAKRKMMIVMAFVLGALLTPPDVLTQILLAVPLIGIYEIAIWYAKWGSLKNSDYRTQD